MARKKTEALIFSFENTTEAMAVEKYCTDNNLPGRIIPIPREITAGCGLAWKAAPEDENILVVSFKDAGMVWSGIYHLQL